MKTDVVATIEKLLRVGQGTGNEATAARERAEALMAKHRVHVSLSRSDERRLPVANVRGVYWREQLLTVIATVTGARVLRSMDGSSKVIVAGPVSSVSLAQEMYEYVSLQIMLLANDRWRLFALGNSRLARPDWDEPRDGFEDDIVNTLGEILGTARTPRFPRRGLAQPDGVADERLDAVASLWQRAFCTIVVGDVAKQLTAAEAKSKGKKKRAPKYEEAPADVRAKLGMKSEADEQRAELAIFEAEIKKLAPIVGDAFARDTVRDAVANGGYSSRNIRFTWRTRKLLTAASSFLPPPPPPPEPVKPTRFNQLDVDW